VAKGQKHSNKEVRKPKSATAKKGAAPAGSMVTTAFAKPSASDTKAKKR